MHEVVGLNPRNLPGSATE